ncbi:MAG: DUF6288 domain-containing protein, partial [Verrucomicrobiota bacterium]
MDRSKFFFLGPTGMKGWMYWSSLTRESRQILVTEVRADTPAEGIMQVDDVILGINGGLFTNDARIAFMDAVNEAEEPGNHGELSLTVFRDGSPATTNTLMIQLAELGTFSPTTPYNCTKIAGLITNFCDYILTNNAPHGNPQGVEASVWMMLGSGNSNYVSWATNWIRSQSWFTRTNLSVYKDTQQKTWYSGYQGITLGQYYLLTGDAEALPAISNLAHFVAQGSDWRGIWGHTMAWPQNNGGQLHGTLPGYGALNQSALTALYTLALARKCGVNDPEVDAAIDRAAHFYRAHVGLGTINYGFNPPVAGVADSNGRNGLAAHVFRCLDEPEIAKWFAMLTSTYGWRDWGHTGNEFNHCWGPMAASIGGPKLAHWVFAERSEKEAHWRTSVTMRRQPEGWYQSQGQEGRGNGRSNGHATGGYGVQFIGHRHNIEITGAGYDTNLYWLTDEEMEQVRFATRYESDKDGLQSLPTDNLTSNLVSFSPRVQNWIAEELADRVEGGDAALRSNLVAIVEDTNEEDYLRAGAVAALGSSNVLVMSTWTNWLSPSNSYILNWRAGYAASGYRDDPDVVTAVLQAIINFDPDTGFDAMTVQHYSQMIYSFSTNILDEAGMDLYWEALGVILTPGGGHPWFISGQNLAGMEPLQLARYADKILRAAETFAMPYDAGNILSRAGIGEGLHSWMVRSSDYVAFGPNLETSSSWTHYGEHLKPYSNFVERLKVNGFHSDRYRDREGRALKYVTQDAKPPLLWFRDLIATNIENSLTNPVTELADLRYNMTIGPDDDLFHAVTLDEIASHPDNTDPFIDITNALGSAVPIPLTHWRLHAGAVELGVTDTNDNARWMAAFSNEMANPDPNVLAGVLHVLAGRQVTQALDAVTNYLYSENDFLAIPALELIGRVGSTNELPMVFNSFLTNC